MIKRPEYVVFDDFGRMIELYCKCCGAAIGGIRDSVVGRRYEEKTNTWIEQRDSKFQRFPNYAELKITFQDGSAHVTNLCKECAKPDLSVSVLKQLHEADMDMEEKQGNRHTAVLRKRVPLRIIAIRDDGGGIV